MIKLIEPIPPKPGLSVQAFRGLSASSARVAGPCEGVAEVWLDLVAQDRALFHNPCYATHAHPDNADFADEEEASRGAS